MSIYHETFLLSLTPKALLLIEPLVRARAEEEWEDDNVQTELLNYANEIRSRLQRIEKGDLQS